MSKNKPKGGGGGGKAAVEEPAAGSKAAAAAARRALKSTKKGGLIQNNLASLSVLVLAVAATVLFSRGQPPKPPQPARRAGSEGGDLLDGCAGWAAEGHCDSNARFMQQNCAASCAGAAPPGRAAAAKVPAQQAKPAKRAPQSRQAPQSQPPAAPAGPAPPPDTNENCGTWAGSGECERNPAYMKEACATSCSPEAMAGKLRDAHQDCAAWVNDGECYRNPAFMLQQCKASCEQFASDNANILQDTSDTCVNFALEGGCDSDPTKASRSCRASCHIQRICGNHTETVFCQKALRCEAITDMDEDCAAKAARGECQQRPVTMLKRCIKSCSEMDLKGMMRFHLPHKRTTLSPLIDLPGTPPRLGGFYSTPPGGRNSAAEARAVCADLTTSFEARLRDFRRRRAQQRKPWGRSHWSEWSFEPRKERTPRVPHRFDAVPAEVGSERRVVVEHISFSPRIRYLHKLLTPEECEYVMRIAKPLFSRSPVRGSVTRVRTSTTAMLGGGSLSKDPTIRAIRNRISRFSGYAENLIEPLQVVRYEQGQKYDGHHDFFDVCDLEDKTSNGRRQVTFLIYLVDMPAGETGGGTAFPELKLEVAPEQGSAIVFNDCFDNGDEDGRSLHAGLKPNNPNTVKYAINGWIRSHPVGHMNAGSLF